MTCFSRRRFPSWTGPLLLSAALFALYGATASRRLTWANQGADGGDLLAAILTGGIPHPTGYPTYLLLGRLLQGLSLGDSYFRVVLLSFLPAACAAGLLCAWVQSWAPHSRWAAWVAGLAWGLSPLLWSQAIIVEVYGLQALFSVLGLWWLTVLLRGDVHRPALYALLALSFGLGIGNHATQVLLAPLCLWGLVVFFRRTRDGKALLGQLAGVLLGGLVYLYLPCSARHFPAVNWGNPQGWSGFWWEVSAQPYRALLGGLTGPALIERLLAGVGLLRRQFGIVGVFLGLLGGLQAAQAEKKLFALSAGMFTGWLAFSLLYDTVDSSVYLMTSWMIFSAWIGVGLAALDGLRWKRLPWLPVACLLGAACFIARAPATFRQIDPRLGYGAAEYAEGTLQDLPQGAILFTSAAEDSFPLWAYHYGWGWRPDLALVVLPLTRFTWYQQTLQHTYPGLVTPPLSAGDADSPDWGAQIGALNPDRPVCRSALQADGQPSVLCEVTP